MTLATKLILIAALVLSIFIPFGYYLLGEKNKGRYKCALAFNVLSYFGTFLVAGIMLFGSVPVTFGLFTEGFEKFDDYYEKGYINKVITTNLTYLPSVVNEKPYFVTADMSKFLALIIDSLNHDVSIGNVLNPTDRIHSLLEKHNIKR